MKELIFFELKKIIRRKTCYISLIVALLICLVLLIMPISQKTAYDTQGNKQYGIEAVRAMKEISHEFPSVLTDENIKNSINEFKDQYSKGGGQNAKSEEDAKAYKNYILPRVKFISYITSTSSSTLTSTEKNINTDTINNYNIYESRNKIVENILSDPNKKYTEAEKEFWLEKNSHVDEPFKYGFFEGWQHILDFLSAFVFIILAICIGVAPVYASEYERGTDSIIFASKYGKSKVNYAKIIASFIFGFLVLTIVLTVSMLMLLIIFGSDGWNAPVQLLYGMGEITFPFNMLQATIVYIGLIYIIALGLIATTLFFSSAIKNSFAALIFSLAIIIGPVFLEFIKIRSSRSILNLFPFQSLRNQFISCMSYQIGNVVFDSVSAIFIIYSLLILIFVPLSIYIFKRRQVK